MNSGRFAFTLSVILYFTINLNIQVPTQFPKTYLLKSFQNYILLIYNFFWATKRRVSKAKIVLCNILFCVQKSHAANEVHDRIFKPTSSPFSTALETLQKQIGYNPFSFPILESLSSTFVLLHFWVF